MNWNRIDILSLLFPYGLKGCAYLFYNNIIIIQITVRFFTQGVRELKQNAGIN